METKWTVYEDSIWVLEGLGKRQMLDQSGT